MTDADVYALQEKIGYQFSNLTLLKQAFVAPSVTEASHDWVLNYQVLEFVGDAVLELSVVKNLVKEFCSIDNDGQFSCVTNEGKLTERKQELVKNETLAHCSSLLGFDSYLERASGYAYYDHKNKRGDLIEAVLGAVAIDSKWDMDVLSAVTKNLLKHKDLDVNYTERLERLCSRKSYGAPLFSFFQNNESEYECCVSVPNAPRVFRGRGKNTMEAQNNAAKDAYKHLKNKVSLKNPQDELLREAGEQNQNPVMSLNNLYLKKLISRPVYDFCQTTKDVWRCEASLENSENIFCAEAASQREAKNIAAKSLLGSILGAEPDDVIIDDESVVRGRGLLKLILTKYQKEACV